MITSFAPLIPLVGSATKKNVVYYCSVDDLVINYSAALSTTDNVPPLWAQAFLECRLDCVFVLRNPSRSKHWQSDIKSPGKR